MEAAAGMPTFRPDERDLTSVEPDHHRSLAGRQTPGEPTRARQAIYEPTRPTTYQTLRTSTRTDRHLKYKSTLHGADVAVVGRGARRSRGCLLRGDAGRFDLGVASRDSAQRTRDDDEPHRHGSIAAPIDSPTRPIIVCGTVIAWANEPHHDDGTRARHGRFTEIVDSRSRAA